MSLPVSLLFQGYVPDCLNITETLTMHANMLVNAGLDYVVADATNLPSPGPMTPPLCEDESCQGKSAIL